MLMRALDPSSHLSSILSSYSTLEQVDPMRRGYYQVSRTSSFFLMHFFSIHQDLKCGLELELVLAEAKDFTCLDLSDLGVGEGVRAKYRNYLEAFQSVKI